MCFFYPEGNHWGFLHFNFIYLYIINSQQISSQGTFFEEAILVPIDSSYQTLHLAVHPGRGCCLFVKLPFFKKLH